MNLYTGIILAPMIFGTTHFLEKKRAWFVRRVGCADILDIYQDHTPSQNALALLKGTLAERKKRLNELASSFDETLLFKQIDHIIEQQVSKGVQKIGLFGFGFGANVFLRFVESRTSSPVVYLACWHPHLIFPEVISSTKKHWALSEPVLSKIPTNISVTLFHGQDDVEAPVGNLERACEWAASCPHVELIEYPKTGHAFSDRNIQNSIPNLPYYWFSRAGRRAHKASWAHAYARLQELTAM